MYIIITARYYVASQAYASVAHSINMFVMSLCISVDNIKVAVCSFWSNLSPENPNKNMGSSSPPVLKYNNKDNE